MQCSPSSEVNSTSPWKLDLGAYEKSCDARLGTLLNIILINNLLVFYVFVILTWLRFKVLSSFARLVFLSLFTFFSLCFDVEDCIWRSKSWNVVKDYSVLNWVVCQACEASTHWSPEIVADYDQYMDYFLKIAMSCTSSSHFPWFSYS